MAAVGSPAERVDAARSGCAPSPLPRVPALEWERRVPGPLAVAPVVDADDSVVLASSAGTLTKLDRRGALAWKVDLGAPPACTPTILADSSIVVVTTTGEAVAVNRAGRELWRTRLPARSRVAPAPLARPDATVVVALDYVLTLLESDGTVRLEATTIDQPIALVGHGDATLVIEREGRVQEWTGEGSLKTIGSLGGRVRAGPALAGDWLIAPIADGTLVELDITTGQSRERWPGSTERTVTAIAAGRAGELAAISTDGVLLLQPRAGAPTLEVPLVASLGTGAERTPTDPTSSWLAPLMDALGTVVAVAPEIPFATVSAGQVHPIGGTGCSHPAGLAPGRAGRLVVTCSSGLVVSLAERGPSPSP
jgi:outer membrane protein assembly factor BamB